MTIAIVAGLLIGLSLGALGGGGSILTVPVLGKLPYNRRSAAGYDPFPGRCRPRQDSHPHGMPPAGSGGLM